MWCPPVVPDVVLHLAGRPCAGSDASMCSASCSAAGTQLIPPSNQPICRPGWRSRMPPKTYLPNISRNERDLADHRHQHHVVLAGRAQRRSRRCGGRRRRRTPRSRPTPRSSRRCRSRSALPSSSLPGFSGSRNVFRPSAFSSVSVRRRPVGVPPVDQADAVEAPVGPLLQLGDVLVVDAEARSRSALSGKCSSASTALGKASSRSTPSAASCSSRRSRSAGARPLQRVVLHQHVR